MRIALRAGSVRHPFGVRRFAATLAAALAFAGTAVAATQTGGPGPDRLEGGRGPDKLVGRGGDDTLIGGGGRDRLFGGGGQDTLLGGAGADRLNGGRGRDVISCGAGFDVVVTDGLDSISSDCESVQRG